MDDQGELDTKDGMLKIIFYTNDVCPWAHRVAILLKELDLPFKKKVIDLAAPRPKTFLELNPRGQVPVIQYSNGNLYKETVKESAIVVQFLADTHPSHLLPSLDRNPFGAVKRARIAYFVDTWMTKIMPYMYSTMNLTDDAEKEKKVNEWVETIGKEIEPLLEDVNPFFDGSTEMTLAEVLTAPFVIRMYHSADGSLLPASLREAFVRYDNFSMWSKAVMSKESVTYCFDSAQYVKSVKARFQKTKGTGTGK